MTEIIILKCETVDECPIKFDPACFDCDNCRIERHNTVDYKGKTEEVSNG